MKAVEAVLGEARARGWSAKKVESFSEAIHDILSGPFRIMPELFDLRMALDSHIDPDEYEREFERLKSLNLCRRTRQRLGQSNTEGEPSGQHAARRKEVRDGQ